MYVSYILVTPKIIYRRINWRDWYICMIIDLQFPPPFKFIIFKFNIKVKTFSLFPSNGITSNFVVRSIIQFRINRDLVSVQFSIQFISTRVNYWDKRSRKQYQWNSILISFTCRTKNNYCYYYFYYYEFFYCGREQNNIHGICSRDTYNILTKPILEFNIGVQKIEVFK